MERNLTILDKDGDLYVQVKFMYYDMDRVEMQCTLYGKNYESEMGIAILMPLNIITYPLTYKEFSSVNEIKDYDVAIIKSKMKDDLKNMESLTFTYHSSSIHHRYIVSRKKDHQDVKQAIVDCYSNFANNTKTIKFISAISPRHDSTINCDSLQCNIAVILTLPDVQPGDDIYSIV